MKRIAITVVLTVICVGSIYLLTRAEQNQWILVIVILLGAAGVVAANCRKRPEARAEMPKAPERSQRRPGGAKAHGHGNDPRYQEVADYREMGYSISEIANMLDITEEQVKSDLRYYKKRNEG